MLFGASGGVFIFNPDSIRKSSYIPPIVFSKLTVANEDITPGGNSLLKVDIDDADKLVLSHKENIFSVHFAALDYTNPQNIQYAYILDGFEKQWTFADKQRSVTYTNLPKGEYVLRSVLPIAMVCGWITNVSWILSFCLLSGKRR